MFDPEHIRLFKLLDSDTHPFFVRGNIPYYDIKAKLGRFKTFGEIALSYTKRRTATVITSKRSYFLTLSKKAFNEICEGSSYQTASMLELLENEFVGLSQNSVADILCSMTEKNYCRGTELVHIGETPPKLYFLKEGSIVVINSLRN